MCTDNLFKRLQVLLKEIAALKLKDPGDAFIIYQSAFADFKTCLLLIEQKSDALKASQD